MNKLWIYIIFQISYLALFFLLYYVTKWALTISENFNDLTRLVLVIYLTTTLSASEFFHFTSYRKNLSKLSKNEQINTKRELFDFLKELFNPSVSDQPRFKIYLYFFLAISLMVVWRYLPKSEGLATTLITVFLVLVALIWSLVMIYLHSPLISRKQR